MFRHINIFKQFLLGLCTLALAVGLISCNPDDNVDTSLIITAIDSNGDKVEGAEINMYLSLNDWIDETNETYGPFLTDEFGEVRLMVIDTGTYLIDAQLDELTNWETGVVKKVVPGFQNLTAIEVVENQSKFLSAVEGKKWILTSFVVNGEEAIDFEPVCELDDFFLFFKGSKSGEFQLNRGDEKCNQLEEESLVGAWSIINSDTNLRIEIGQDIFTWNIETLNAEKLVVNYIDLGNAVVAEYSSED